VVQWGGFVEVASDPALSVDIRIIKETLESLKPTVHVCIVLWLLQRAGRGFTLF